MKQTKLVNNEEGDLSERSIQKHKGKADTENEERDSN